MFKKESENQVQSLTYIRSLVGSNVFKRAILGSIMLSSFIILTKSDKSYIIGFIFCLTLSICYEIISIVKKPNRPFCLNKFLCLYFATILFSMNTIQTMFRVYPNLRNISFFSNIKAKSFYCYALGLMVFIFSLRKDRLRSQLVLITVVHFASYVLGVVCSFAILNLDKGKFYFFYPAILVISNDIFAYIIGKLIGRTPLFSLSPNKTLEGFIGASLFTFLTGILLCYLKLNYNFLPDSLDKISSIPVNRNVWYFNYPALYLHNVMFTIGASFVAPFLGFLASAIKRAFNKKDFGDVIPGHGGVTDRMDCQLMMVFFIYFYMQAFFESRAESVIQICNYIAHKYSNEEIGIIISKIREIVQ